MLLRLGLDVDGVFADFNAGFRRQIVAITGRDLFPAGAYEPPEWNYPKGLGYTPEEISQTWRSVEAAPAFWSSLSPYPGAAHALRVLNQGIFEGHWDVTFLTTRGGTPTARRQTAEWLHWHELSFPQVAVCHHEEDKARFASAFKVDVVIDDKVSNLETVYDANRRKVHVVLLDRAWNRSTADRERLQREAGALFHVVTSLAQFLTLASDLRQRRLSDETLGTAPTSSPSSPRQSSPPGRPARSAPLY
jgi:hypothetical protein